MRRSFSSFARLKVLIIDNFDSFTYNLVQAVQSLGASVTVIRNNAPLSSARGYDRIIISPGPGHPSIPRDRGICGDVIEEQGASIPILGVCFGHQLIGAVFGGHVIRAPLPMHGKQSIISHDGCGVFRGVRSRPLVMRYHSLVIDRATLPSSLVITATTDDGLIMGVRHRKYPLEGVQFHPESYFTQDGLLMLKNFLEGTP